MSERQHLRADGKPKRAFESRGEALQFVRPLQAETAVYRCGVCGKWHVATPQRKRIQGTPPPRDRTSWA